MSINTQSANQSANTRNAVCRLLAVLLPAFVLIGCNSTPSAPDASSSFVFADADYAQAFDAARDVLIQNRFTIDRVDASEGVITTLPKRTAGLASPWDREQSSAGQEWADLLHHHERVIRVSFARGVTNDAECSVLASIVRIRRPNWRLETESIRTSTHARTIKNNGTPAAAIMREPIGEDAPLSSRLAHEILQHLSIEDDTIPESSTTAIDNAD